MTRKPPDACTLPKKSIFQRCDKHLPTASATREAAAGAEGSWVNGVLFSKIRIRALSSHQDSRSFLAGNRAGPGSPLATKEHSSGASSAARAPSRGSRGQDAPGQSPPPPRTRRPAGESLRPRSARESKNAGRGPRRRSGKGRQENANIRLPMAAAGARRGRERTRRSFYSADGGPQESILPAQAAPPSGPRPCPSPRPPVGAAPWLAGGRVGSPRRAAEAP